MGSRHTSTQSETTQIWQQQPYFDFNFVLYCYWYLLVYLVLVFFRFFPSSFPTILLYSVHQWAYYIAILLRLWCYIVIALNNDYKILWMIEIYCRQFFNWSSMHQLGPAWIISTILHCPNFSNQLLSSYMDGWTEKITYDKWIDHKKIYGAFSERKINFPCFIIPDSFIVSFQAMLQFSHLPSSMINFRNQKSR